MPWLEEYGDAESIIAELTEWFRTHGKAQAYIEGNICGRRENLSRESLWDEVVL